MASKVCLAGHTKPQVCNAQAVRRTTTSVLTARRGVWRTSSFSVPEHIACPRELPIALMTLRNGLRRKTPSRFRRLAQGDDGR